MKLYFILILKINSAGDFREFVLGVEFTVCLFRNFISVSSLPDSFLAFVNVLLNISTNK